MRTAKYFKANSAELIDPVLLPISKRVKWHAWYIYGYDKELAFNEAQAWTHWYKLESLEIHSDE